MNEENQDQNSIEANSKGLSREQKIELYSDIINKIHKETFKNLAEIEQKNLEFELMMAEHIWQVVKGLPIPDDYSVEDRMGIFARYYHRAVAKSQGE